MPGWLSALSQIIRWGQKIVKHFIKEKFQSVLESEASSETVLELIFV